MHVRHYLKTNFSEAGISSNKLHCLTMHTMQHLTTKTDSLAKKKN